MFKTLRIMKVDASSVSFDENGNMVETKLDPFIYEGRKKSPQALKKIFREMGAEGEIIIKKESEETKTYEISLDDFLLIAKEVDACKDTEREE